MKLATRIMKAKGSRKNDLYLSVYGSERRTVLEDIILGLPAGTYLLKTCGMAAPNLPEVVGRIAGVFAETDVTEKMLRGMSVTYPERIKVSFTLGLEEITVLPKNRTLQPGRPESP